MSSCLSAILPLNLFSTGKNKMFFEEALAAMRFGEAVICDGRSDPLCVIDDQICELTHNGFEPLDSMNTCNIMRSDWRIFGIEDDKKRPAGIRLWTVIEGDK